MNAAKHAPRNCPVCGEILSLTRLSCDECGTELAGHFPTCEYCTLSAEDRATLRVFLKSRGNMKELERHLGVSYPTARTRFDAILVRLGLEIDPGDDNSGGHSRSHQVLDDLSAGKIDVEEAIRRLG